MLLMGLQAPGWHLSNFWKRVLHLVGEGHCIRSCKVCNDDCDYWIGWLEASCH